MKKLSKKWTTVTPLSKTIALCMLIILPILGVFLGYKLRGDSLKLASSEKPEAARVIRVRPDIEIENGSNAVCGDYTRSEIGVDAGDFEIVSGPEWAPDCRHIAWSVFQSGTGFVTPPGEPEPSIIPISSVNTKGGLFIYNDRTKKVNRVVIPESPYDIPTFVGWNGPSYIVYTKNGEVGKDTFYYNLITGETTSK